MSGYKISLIALVTFVSCYNSEVFWRMNLCLLKSYLKVHIYTLKKVKTSFTDHRNVWTSKILNWRFEYENDYKKYSSFCYLEIFSDVGREYVVCM